MDGLRTARVLVLDNEIEEARQFMEALAKRGIGSTYFSGDIDTLPCPDRKLTGIRLAALDLELDVEGTGTAPSVISRLLGTVNRIVSHDNGPYLAIAWTSRDEEYFNEFVNRLEELECQPIQVIRMYKPDYTVPGGIDKIFGQISETLDDSYPLGLLAFWEQIIHDSSGGVMGVVPDDGDWLTQSKETLRLLLDATDEAEDAAGIQLRTLLSSFNALQLDTIESHIASLQEQTVGTLVEPLDKTDSSDNLQLKAKLNHRLLCTPSNPRVSPGNVYLSETVCSPQTGLFPTLQDLLDEMALKGKEQQLKDAGCVAIALEVTPLCDYRHSKRSRFLCGLALPYLNRRHYAKRPTGFLRTDGAPISFETGPLAGTKLLVWNSRWVVTIPTAMAGEDASLFRLRQAPLIDIQSWLAGQQNRPGYLSITTQWGTD